MTPCNPLADVYEGRRVPNGTPLRRATYFCRTAMRERGWTDRLVDLLLGEPDEIRDNPYISYPLIEYRPFRDMRLWRKERVYRGERRSAFVNRPRRKRAAGGHRF
jgi:hypothetical protein